MANALKSGRGREVQDDRRTPNAFLFDLEDTIVRLRGRQRAIQIVAAPFEKSGMVTVCDWEADALLFLLGEQMGAINALQERYDAIVGSAPDTGGAHGE